MKEKTQSILVHYRSKCLFPGCEISCVSVVLIEKSSSVAIDCVGFCVEFRLE